MSSLWKEKKVKTTRNDMQQSGLEPSTPRSRLLIMSLSTWAICDSTKAGGKKTTLKYGRAHSASRAAVVWQRTWRSCSSLTVVYPLYLFYSMVQKSQMTKNSNQGGSCLKALGSEFNVYLVPPLTSTKLGCSFRKESYPVPLTKKSATLNSFLPRAIVSWNVLPAEVQSSNTLTFKNRLRGHFSLKTLTPSFFFLHLFYTFFFSLFSFHLFLSLFLFLEFPVFSPVPFLPRRSTA